MIVTKFPLTLGLLVVVLGSCAALRCRTEDGPSVEEVKKVVRTCMNNHEAFSNGQRSNRHQNNDDYDDSSDENDSDDNSSQENDRYSNNNHHNGQQQQGHKYQRGDGQRSSDGGQNNNQYERNSNGHNNQYDRNENNYQNQRQPHMVAAGRADRFALGPRQSQSAGNSWPYSNGMRADGNNNKSNSSRDTDNDHNNFTSKNAQKDSESCMVLCFFQEMKMTNRDGYPDRHKMMHVMRHELRDMQLKDFYTDTIQECHHILEMEQSRDKCTFARHLVTCLSERAQTNCEDFQDSFIF